MKSFVLPMCIIWLRKDGKELQAPEIAEWNTVMMFFGGNKVVHNIAFRTSVWSEASIDSTLPNVRGPIRRSSLTSRQKLFW